MSEVTQSDRITYAVLRLDRSLDWWTSTDVQDVLSQIYGDDAPTRKTVQNRLHGLQEVGVLVSLRNSSRTYTRYQVAEDLPEIDREREQTPAADPVDDEPTGFDAPEPPAGQGTLEEAADRRDFMADAARRDPVDDVRRELSAGEIVDELELPGSGETLKERRAAVSACYRYLRENGSATKSDFTTDVYPDQTGRFESAGGWWNAIGKQGLRALANELEEIDAPGEGEHIWYWRG